MQDSRSDTDLLAATPGDPAAFGVFYRRHETRILGYFRQRVDSAELAADLAAETFAAALLTRASYCPRIGPPVGWLFGIARHVLLMSRRRGRVEQRARRKLAMPPLDLTDELIERIDTLRGDATAALADLSPDERDAVQARVVDERDYAEIGRELQCSPAVVRQRVSRGLKHLRERLEET